MKFRFLYEVIGGYFRRKRGRWLTAEFCDCPSVIDLGGVPETWQGMQFAKRVTLLNITESPKHLPANLTYIRGDGRKTALPDGTFALAFSNSVIEHVGSFDDQQRFAHEMLRLGRRIYCQTPNRWFPVETHFLTLFVHWLPRRCFTYWVHRYLTLQGLVRRPDRKSSSAVVQSIRLLSRQELARLFPGCAIRTEHFLGLPKSFIVWR